MSLPLSLLLVLALLSAAVAGCAPDAPPPDRSVAPTMTPLVIAHRGASGVRPEHTIEAYDLAIQQGADYIEPDLVVTSDGVLIARHENELSDTTDVADRAEFSHLRTKKFIDGKSVEGWFAEDFTLAQIKTLRARQRIASRDQTWNDRFAIPTFDEVLALAIARGRERGRVVGVYPETKHPGYFRSISLELEPRLLASLRRVGWDRADAPVFIQSFEVQNLRALATQTRVPLVQLIAAEGGPAEGGTTYAQMITPAGLREIATYARGIGVHKSLVVPVSRGRTALPPTSLVADAHAAGLLVHAWTFCSDPQYLLPSYPTPAEEYLRFFELGIDGVFSDFPDAAVRARDGR